MSTAIDLTGRPALRAPLGSVNPESPLIERTVRAGFVLALGLLVAIGAVSYKSLDRQEEQNAWAARQSDTMGTLQALISALSEVETSQGRYVIVGDERILEVRPAALATVEGRLRDLRQATAAGDPALSRAVETLAQDVGARIALSNEAIRLRREQGFEAARAQAATGAGQRASDRARRDAAAIDAALSGALGQRVAHQREESRLTRMRIAGGSGLAFAFVAVALVLVHRGFERSRGAEAELRSAHDGLEARVRERTAKLARSSEAFRLLVEQAPVSLALFDREMRYLAVSERWREVHGRGRADLIGRSHYEIHPDLPEVWREAHRRGLAGEILRKDEDLWVHEDGTRQWLAWAIHPWRDAQGELGGIIITTNDITRRQVAEEKLRHNEALLSRTSRLARVGGWEFDVTTRQGTWTEETARIHDLDPSDATNVQKGLSFYVGESREAIEKAVAGAIEEGREYELDLEMMTPAGTHKWVRTVGHPVVEDGRVVRVEGAIQDITDRKRTEHDLRRSEERFRELAETLDQVFWIADPETNKVLYVNPAYETVWGRTCESLLANSNEWLEAIVPEDRDRVLHAANTQQNAGTYDVEYRIRRPDGTERFILDKGVPVKDAAGQVCRIIGVAQDITGRKLSERQVVDEKLFSETLLAGLPGTVVVVDRAGRLVRWNRTYEDVVGAAAADLRDRDALWAIVEEDRPALIENMGKIFEQGQGEQVGGRLRRADGALRDYVFSGTRVDIGGEPLLVGIGLDVSELRASQEQRQQLEAQLLQSQKLEAVGRLAGGVAHDFNNMLNVILGYADLAIRKLRPADPLRKHLEEIRSAARRSADLTRQLLAFSRRQAIAPRVLDLNDQVRAMDGMLRRIIGEDVELDLCLQPEPWPVSMDPSQIDQVVANLAVNARDAMPDGGRLTIETLNVSLDDAYCRMHADARPGDYVMLAVTDDGCGMDASTLDRVFEPFFTTKPEGQGTGLGLATVYGIARQNAGSVEVYSEPGAGTTMRVYLPRCLDAGQSNRDPAAAAALPEHGHETVLLVEDEPMLRELSGELLAELGYRVLSAAGPTEALAIAGRMEESIDLLLTDVVMPVMSGKELAERLTALRPGLRVVFTSGYTANAIARSGMLEPGIEFLPKPFTMAGLASKMREVLAKAR